LNEGQRISDGNEFDVGLFFAGIHAAVAFNIRIILIVNKSSRIFIRNQQVRRAHDDRFGRCLVLSMRVMSFITSPDLDQDLNRNIVAVDEGPVCMGVHQKPYVEALQPL